MFWYDKDPHRMMEHKKREIIEELHNEKIKILQELSGVDKITLTRLRELLSDYNRIEHNLNVQYEKINAVLNQNSGAMTAYKKEVEQLIRENETNLQKFENEIRFLDALNVRLSPEHHHNSDGLINEFFKICKTYTDNFDKLVYGNNETAYSLTCNPVDGKYEIDCSSFINLLIHGVTFENSRYNGHETNIENGKFFTDIDGIVYRSSNDIAEYLYNNGYTFTAKPDFSNLEPGDLLFFSWENMAGDEFHENAFMKIDHVCMYMGRKNESTYHTIQYVDSNPNFLYNVKQDYMGQCVLVARLPFTQFSTVTENTTDETAVLTCSTGSTLGGITLEKAMIPGKLYTLFMDGQIETENCYFVLQGLTESSVKTLYSCYGEVWDGTEKR